MNTPLRRVALAVMGMIILLLANATYIQVVQADEYRSDTRNRRVLLDEYGRQRGQINAGGLPVASSEDTGGQLRFTRTYLNGPLYAPVTGYYSLRYGAGGTEQALDPVLNGSDGRLFVRRLSDLITGRDPRGGNVELTINPIVQQAAYDELTRRGYTGSVVAIKPDTGEILGMVSTPSYDPNRLASHDGAEQQSAWNEYISKNNGSPLTNRAVQSTYPPGSTFKVVVTAAALENDVATPDTALTAASSLELEDTATSLRNFANSNCGSGPTATLTDALVRSCNTAFAELIPRIGEDDFRRQAERFGIGEQDLAIPIPVEPSTLGDIPDTAALQQSSIGQRDVALTPLQNAVVAATIANGGVRMEPQLVRNIVDPELNVMDDFDPRRAGTAMSDRTAEQIRDMMVAAETSYRGEGKNPSLGIAAKTGTAEHGADPKNTPPHAWYIAFAPANDPQIAIAVVVEDGGDRSLEATGGSRAAPIGRAVIAAALQGVSNAGDGGAKRGARMTLTTGQLLAQRYLLGRQIAVGGMGEVWEASDTRLDRQVAVKVLRPELSGDPEFRDRFHTEARLAASLNHPGIAGVHDYGETATAGTLGTETSGAFGTATSGALGTAYLVMELVAGDSLAAILQRHPRLGTDRTLDILRQAAEALQAAHERGLVHRDVKPGNILITPTGQVKLTDFGVAKAVNTAPVTRQGMVMGTAHYIAPEQAAGDPAGPASDVYALGVVGYECLAGRRPFLSDNALTVAMMHIRDAAPPLPPDVPPGARALIDTALAKDPWRRYSTGGEFAAAIAAVAAGRPPPLPTRLATTAVHSNPALHSGRQLPHTALLAAGSLAGPPTGQYPGGYPPQAHSPQFPPYPRQRQARRRGTVGITVAVLAVLGLVLGGFGIREAVLRSTGTTPQADPEVAPGDPVLPPPPRERVSTAPETNDEEPAQPRTRDNPGNIFIIVTDYVLRSGSEAASIAMEQGLEPLVVDEDGDEIDPEDQTQCLVTRVDPVAGWVPAGSLLELTCEEVS